MESGKCPNDTLEVRAKSFGEDFVLFWQNRWMFHADAQSSDKWLENFLLINFDNKISIWRKAPRLCSLLQNVTWSEKNLFCLLLSIIQNIKNTLREGLWWSLEHSSLHKTSFFFSFHSLNYFDRQMPSNFHAPFWFDFPWWLVINW